MQKAIFLDGVPTNLEAAALDAMEWLKFTLEQGDRRGAFATWHTREKLVHAMAELEKYLPYGEPELRISDGAPCPK